MLLQGALDAENYVGLKCNVQERDLKAVLEVMPALHNPTVSSLSDKGWVAVETVLHTTEIKHVVPRLKRAGASGIVEFPITKIIA
jgi:ATP phosphoribosyltransferase